MRIKSNVQRTSSLSLTFIILGGLMIYLVNRNSEPRPGEHWAYLAGLFLITLGTYVFIMAEKMIITTNTAKQGLQVRRRNLLYQKTELVPYSNVLSVHAVRIGRRAGLKTYHLVIRLNDGKKLAPGRWSRNPAEINAVAHELAQEVGCEVKDAPVYSLPNLKSGLMSGLGAVLIYVMWYRIQVGEVCLAMWHGNAPAIIIPFGFAVLLFLFRTRIN